MLILVSLVSLMFTLTMLLLNTFPMKRLFVFSSVLWLNGLLITIYIQVQTNLNKRELVEAHHMSLSENMHQHISYKNTKKKTI